MPPRPYNSSSYTVSIEESPRNNASYNVSRSIHVCIYLSNSKHVAPSVACISLSSVDVVPIRAFFPANLL